jgi:hypothetical protein
MKKLLSRLTFVFIFAFLFFIANLAGSFWLPQLGTNWLLWLCGVTFVLIFITNYFEQKTK